ncbi:MAG TPA: DNA polymerase III subunit gamma/tau [Candidatus Saccharimonadales bacterium]|nr:DNA polymerase III subunit gamma/tau [Candidatus Saccharimonadales bacterium]
MGQALYRKYRSRSLDEIVGQEHITTTLAQALKAGRISHAYLFTGPRGTGKTSIARILAHEINKIPYADTPNLDIVEIDAASNRRIDDIRDLREKVHITPIATPYKVYIIDEVHMLTGESFNALLKTLEEPPAHVVFILATTEVHKLPATIISRTQRFSFRHADPKKLVAHLKNIAEKEGIPITDDALELIAEHGDGSFRDSVSLLDQLATINAGTITAEGIEQTLGIGSKKAIANLVDALVNGDHQKANTALQSLESASSTPAALVIQLAKALTVAAQFNPNLYELIDSLLEVPRAYNPRLKLLALLLGFASKNHAAKPAKTIAERVTASPVIELPIPTKQPIPEPVTPPVIEPDVPPAPMSDFSNEAWGAILTKVKATNIPLHSVLKHAQPQWNAEAQKLTLFFKYQLHRKKLDDAKQKAALAQIVTSILGGRVAIATEVSKDAVPSTITTDPTVASVAAIMGGGEVVDAPSF